MRGSEVCQIKTFPYHRREKPKIFARTCGFHPFEGFVPWVISQGKFTDMHGKQIRSLQVRSRLHGFFRYHVHKTPALIVLPAVKQGNIDFAEFFTESGKMFPVAAVPAEKQFQIFVSSTNPHHNVLLRTSILPEKCCAGTILILISLSETTVSPQSPSIICSL